MELFNEQNALRKTGVIFILLHYLQNVDQARFDCLIQSDDTLIACYQRLVQKKTDRNAPEPRLSRWIELCNYFEGG